MKKIFGIIILLISFCSGFSQSDVNTHKLTVRDSLKLKSRFVKDIHNDTTLAAQDPQALTTEYAVYWFVLHHAGSGGGLDSTYDTTIVKLPLTHTVATSTRDSIGADTTNTTYGLATISMLKKKVDSVTTNSDSTQLRYWIAGTAYTFYDITTGLTGSDTTVFQTSLDSTGQPGQRVLWSANKKIHSDQFFIYDSARHKLVLGNKNISVGGPNTKLYVVGNAIINGTITAASFIKIGGTSAQYLMADGSVSTGGGGGGGASLANFYLKDSILSGNRTVTMAGNSLNLKGGKTNMDSSSVGTNYSRIGTLINQSWLVSGTPAGYTVGSGLSVSYTGNKATITGGSSLGSPGASFITTPFTSGIQFNTLRMPFEKMDFKMTIVPTTKSANAVVGMATGVMGNTFWNQKGIFWDLSNGSNSGRVAINSQYLGYSLPTFVTNGDSTSKMNFNIGDTLDLYFHQDGWSVTAGIINRTQGTESITYFNTAWFCSAGLWNFCFLNGNYVLTNIFASSFDRKGGVWFWGNSHVAGAGNSQQSRRFPDLTMRSNPKYFGVVGLPSIEAKYWVLGGLTSELITFAAPSQVVLGDIAYNDESASETAPTTMINVDSIIAPLQRAGIPVYPTGIVPRNTTTDVYNDSIRNLCTALAIPFIDIRPSLTFGTGQLNPAYNYDGVHLNDSGHIIISNIISSTIGVKIYSELAADTNNILYLKNIQTSETPATNGLLGYEANGKVVGLPNFLPTPNGWIQNKFGVNLGTAQTNARVHTSDPLISDSALFIHNKAGLLLGFNGGNIFNGGRTGTNIEITNWGTNGIGYPQKFATSSSVSGNVIIGSQVKANTPTLIGNYNLLLGYGSASSISSGFSNILLSAGVQGSSITTGNNNIVLSNIDLGPNIGSNQVIMGSTSASWGDKSNRIFIGQSNYLGDAGSGMVVLAPNGLTASQLFVGNQLIGGGNPRISFSGDANTNGSGFDSYFDASIGNGTGNPGRFLFDFSVPSAQTTLTNTLQVESNGVVIGKSAANATPAAFTRSPSAILDIQSTVSGIGFPRMTTTQRNAISVSGVLTGIIVSGSGYVNGTYTTVPLTGGAGSGAQATIVITTTNVATVIITIPGTGYLVGDVLSASNTNLGGSGSGFTYTLTTITGMPGLTIFNTTTNYTNVWDGIKWAQAGGTANYAHTIFTPTTGQTITGIVNQYNIINPSGTLAALTINLPSSPNNNDVVYLKFTQNISTVTYASGTVVDGITAPTAGSLTVLTYDSSTTSWY